MKKCLIVLFAVLAGGCIVPGLGSNPGGGSFTTIAGLKHFESCGALSDYLVPMAKEKSSPVFVSPTVPISPMVPDSPMTSDPAPDSASGGEVGAAAPQAEPVTVEEADIVKQDGNRLYIVAGKDLLTYDITDLMQPERIGRVTFDFSPQEIFVDGSKVVVIGFLGYGTLGATTSLRLIDLTDAAAPAVVRELELDGFYVESRMVGSSVYLALQNWMGGDSSTLARQIASMSPCSKVYVPEDLEGDDYEALQHWDIVGFNLDEPSSDPVVISIIGSYESTIYATPEHFYLASLSYESDRTSVFLLGLDPAVAGVTPRANAAVPGRLVNQFSMDETDGVLRIATTTNRATFGAADNRNYVSTFQANDASLSPLGQIDSITPGESISAARFLGKIGYLTTFVTKDPLLAIDLSDPRAPAVVGELHLPGYTSYLHPYGDFLVAIGSEAEFGGNVLLNLFDVSDITSPKLVEQETIPDSWSSEALREHRAFAFFDDLAILAIPVETDSGSEIALYRVDTTTGFARLGAVNHDDLVPAGAAYSGYSPQMRRALEEGGGNFLYTVSEAGLKVNTFANLTNDLFGETFPGFSATGGVDCGGPGPVVWFDCME